MANVNDKILDAIIEHQIQIVRLGIGEGNKANETIDKSIPELKAALALALIDIDSSPTKANQQKLAVLERKIKRIRKPAFDQAKFDQNEEMEELAQEESNWTQRVIGGIAALFLLGLTDLQIERIVNLTIFAGRTFDEWWESAFDSDIRRIMTAVQSGISNQATTKEIVDSVIGTKTVAGTLKTTRNEVEAVSRTVATGVSNSVQDAVVKKSQGIDRVMWSSILDSKTSTICRGLAGTIWLIEEPHPTPPAHNSCRSSLTYLVVGDEPPQDVTYDEFLKTKSDAFIDEVLPKWQAAEYRKGVPLDRFVAKDLQPLTMVEYKALNK